MKEKRLVLVGKIVVELNIVFPNVVVRIELLQLEIHDADFFHDLQGFRGKGKGQGAAQVNCLS